MVRYQVIQLQVMRLQISIQVACFNALVPFAVFFQPKQLQVASVSNVCKSAVSGSARIKRNSSGAMSPRSAVRQYSDRLTAYELQEITSFSHIYYLGTQLSSKKINVGTPSDNFDDDEHAYRLIDHDHINYRYEIMKIIGKGSFGQVCISLS